MAASKLLIEMSFQELLQWDATHSDLQLVALAMYGRPNHPYFAAIWLDLGAASPRVIRLTDMLGESQTSTNDEASDTSQAGFVGVLKAVAEAEEGDGRYPILVSATGAVGYAAPLGARAVVVFEERANSPGATFYVAGSASDVVKGSDTPVSADSCVSTLSNGSTREHHLALYHTKREDRWATLFSYAAHRPVGDWPSGFEHSPEVEAIRGGWSRAHFAAPHPSKSETFVEGQKGRAMFALYRDDTLLPWPDDILDPFDCGSFIDGPIRRELVAGIVGLRVAEDRWPIAIGANGRGNDVRFCITWAARGRYEPLPRRFHVVRGVDDSTTKRMTPFDGPDRLPPPKVTWPEGGHQPFVRAPLPALPRDAATFQHVQPVALSSHPESGLQVDGPTLDLVQTEADKALLAIEDIARKNMRNGGMHGGQLALAKNGRLKAAWAFTYAESNYPVTQPHHKLRWGSVAKLLTGMRVAALNDDAFYEMNLFDAFGLQPSDIPSTANPAIQQAIQKSRQLFASTTVGDLCQHRAGWRTDRRGVPELKPIYKYYQQAFLKGRHELPLEPGDFKSHIVGSLLTFVKTNPGRREAYNNAHYLALSEVLSLRVRGTTDSYSKVMNDWWQDSIGALEARWDSESQSERIDWGELPMRVRPGFGYSTFVGKSSFDDYVDPAHWPALRPRGYNECRDYGVSVGSGSWSMSAVAMVRVLQGMHPDPPEPAMRLMSWDRVLKGAEQAFNTDTGVGVHGLLGAQTYPNTDFADRTVLQLVKSGNTPGGRAGVWHWTWQESDLVQSVSFADSCTGPNYIDSTACVPHIETLQREGFLDTEEDLFPGYGFQLA